MGVILEEKGHDRVCQNQNVLTRISYILGKVQSTLRTSELSLTGLLNANLINHVREYQPIISIINHRRRRSQNLHSSIG